MLELYDLKHDFGVVRALDGLSFTVPDGTLYGFVGRNGSFAQLHGLAPADPHTSRRANGSSASGSATAS